jgi:hypothetical protein
LETSEAQNEKFSISLYITALKLKTKSCLSSWSSLRSKIPLSLGRRPQQWCRGAASSAAQGHPRSKLLLCPRRCLRMQQLRAKLSFFPLRRRRGSWRGWSAGRMGLGRARAARRRRPAYGQSHVPDESMRSRLRDN